MNREKNFLSVVVYVYNSEAAIADFLTNIDNLLKTSFEAYEYVIVNDASTDASIRRISEVSDNIYGNISIVNLAWKHNIELAMLAGGDMAIGDFIFEIDSTVIDYPLDFILEVYRKCLQGYDVVAASPHRPLKPGSRVFYRYLNQVSYIKMELTTETFRIISRRALNRVLRSKEKLRYRKALYHYSGFSTTILQYEPTGRIRADRNMTLGEKIRLASEVLIEFSNIGTMIAGTISVLFLLLSVICGVYTVHAYLTLKNIEPGWTTTMLFLSGSFTGMFMILFLLSKYITIILNEIQDRPKYIYKSVEKLSRRQE